MSSSHKIRVKLKKRAPINPAKQNAVIVCINFSLVQPLGPQKDGVAWSQTSLVGRLLGPHSEGSFVRWTDPRGSLPLWHVWKPASEAQRGDPGSPRLMADCFHSGASARFSLVSSISVGKKIKLKWENFQQNVIFLSITIIVVAVGSWRRRCLCKLSCGIKDTYFDSKQIQSCLLWRQRFRIPTLMANIWRQSGKEHLYFSSWRCTLRMWCSRLKVVEK